MTTLHMPPTTWVNHAGLLHLLDHQLPSACCMRGRHHSVKYTLTCLDKERMPCPDWKNIIVLDFKPGFRAFANMEVYTGIEQFLCNYQENKLFHIDFSCTNDSIAESESYPVFYKTLEWQRLIRMLDTLKLVPGTVALEISMRFTKGQDIGIIKISSYNFIIKCWNIIQNNINFEKFSIISYIHSWAQQQYIIRSKDGITYGPQILQIED